jgi:hypothetical protein
MTVTGQYHHVDTEKAAARLHLHRMMDGAPPPDE